MADLPSWINQLHSATGASKPTSIKLYRPLFGATKKKNRLNGRLLDIDVPMETA